MSDPSPAKAATPLVSARGLRKDFRLDGKSIEVLRGVDLALQGGEFLAIQGASGAGKSTLLHLLGGLDAPSAGQVWFAGEDLGRMSAGALADLRNRKIGFVFQAYHLLPDLDALENVCLPARLARTPAGEAEKRARELLARVGLGARLGHRPRQLSGGEQQRVAIARALVNRPLLVLADEPTGNLDSRTGDAIIDLLCELRREQGSTLVVATHEAGIAARAERLAHLTDGVIQGPGNGVG